MNNVKYILASAIFSMALAGCAGIKRDNYAGNIVYTNLKVAKTSTHAIGEVKSNDFKNIKISEKSPTLDTPQLKGRYEIVNIKGEKGSSFNIVTIPICDCLGFRKWMISPHTFLLDSEGEIISSGNMMNGAFPSSGDFSVLIVANILNEGNVVGKIVDPIVLAPGHFAIPIKSHPTGIVQIKFNRP